MQEVRSLNRSWPRRILVIFLLILLTLSLAVLFFDKLASFYINRFTDVNFTYDKWGPSLFDRSDIKGVHLALKGSGAGLNAGEIHIDLDISKWLGSREVILFCKMKEISFIAGGENVPRLFPPDSVLAVPFNSMQKYDSISFKLFSSRDTVKLSGFKAHSKNIRMEGDYSLVKGTDEVAVDFKISFSPEIAASFDENIRENVLSADENGWYSTIINYKGNVLLLKALYSFTIAP